MAPNNLIGKLDIPQRIYDNENSIHNPKYQRSGQFIEDFTSNNDLCFCSRWFHLGTFTDVYNDIFEYFDNYEEPFFPIQDKIIDQRLRVVSILENKKLSPIIILSDEQIKLMKKEIPERDKKDK
jgi:hypothetical protein